MPYVFKALPTITLQPAYGKIYLTEEEVLKDWKDGKDFKVSNGGPYTSIRDHHRLRHRDGYDMISIWWQLGSYLEVTNIGE